MADEREERLSAFVDTQTGESIDLYVIEETTIGGVRYLLAAENDDEEESRAYIFKEIAEDDDTVTYEPIEDDTEYDAIVKVFAELLGDVDLVDE